MKWRIVTDIYSGYEVQCRPWWWPFWSMYKVNTFSTLERAQQYLKRAKKTVVYVDGENVCVRVF